MKLNEIAIVSSGDTINYKHVQYEFPPEAVLVDDRISVTCGFNFWNREYILGTAENFQVVDGNLVVDVVVSDDHEFVDEIKRTNDFHAIYEFRGCYQLDVIDHRKKKITKATLKYIALIPKSLEVPVFGEI